ncbi:biotin attachment protein [Acetobacterium wieringae]|uniref:Biotin attachment protein n=1 Tax=Acetobacterium wieringae TaxID=52694 RepID=A0A1F2PIJ8_9FIRM|nr:MULTISPECIES: biotin/lipoyl-containing protein [Acetobacterium]MEA4805707.1 biotin/lipoyl-containing protein [Acetobacterium wieringae]OFV71159.1 dihydrolipoyllysine-residue succinyltransferase component of 2-oxoglutarate dehydrogenase complex [Acetobacterium wieringae]OXS26139.1 MAG: biotin attachment protein [Acetobacterium sp. MES1]URN84487.1 biotin attachment protein [Acetobacterium wieringae]UYO62929.1 biotin attachment protein [Acetobacterium wieringae]
MKKNIQMPKLSEQMESGVLASWNKEVGEVVEKGEVLFEIEMDKVVSEVESMESGVLEAVFFEEGDEIKADEIIAVINCD